MIAEPSSLTGWVDTQPQLLDPTWFDALDDRKKEEAEFHDADRAGHGDESRDSSPNRRFYAVADPVTAATDAWIARVSPGATFLDYACGHGTNAIRAARHGAALAVGIDISGVSVQNAQENAERDGVRANTRFLQRDCEATGLPDASFTACLCSGMLHHLDLTRAFPELARITAPRGRIFCVEALGYNPVIQWYRNRTPELRTAWEKDHILTLKEVRYAQQWFDVASVRYYLMATPAAMLLPSILQRPAVALGRAVDSVLTRTPYVQRWSWMFTFELVKR